MTTTTMTTSAIREELAQLLPAIDEAGTALDRASATGEDLEIARCRQVLADLEQESSDLHSALRGAQEFESEESAARLLRAKREAKAATDSIGADLERQVGELLALDRDFRAKIAQVHETEDRFAAAVARARQAMGDEERRATLSKMSGIAHIVGRLQIEDTLDRYDFVGLGRGIGLQVTRAREAVDRILGLV